MVIIQGNLEKFISIIQSLFLLILSVNLKRNEIVKLEFVFIEVRPIS
jgi:hypothetical protein